MFFLFGGVGGSGMGGYYGFYIFDIFCYKRLVLERKYGGEVMVA